MESMLVDTVNSLRFIDRAHDAAKWKELQDRLSTQQEKLYTYVVINQTKFRTSTDVIFTGPFCNRMVAKH